MTEQMHSMNTRPGTDFYDPWFKTEFNIPHATMYTMLREMADREPKRDAIYFLKKTFSFADLAEEIERAARALVAAGFKAGDVITLCLPNIPQNIILFYAANKLGLIAQMLHPMTPPKAIARAMKAASGRALFLAANYFEKHGMPTNGTSFFKENDLPVIVCSVEDYNTGLMTLFQKKSDEPCTDERGCLSWEAFCGRQAEVRYVRDRQDDLSPSVYLHSGGTTGDPKIIVLNDRAFNAISFQMYQLLDIQSMDAKTAERNGMLLALPLFHGFGLCVGMHSAFANGLPAFLMPKFSPAELADGIRRKRIGNIFAVPTMLEAMLSSADFKRLDCSAVRNVFCGGDFLNPELRDRFNYFIAERGSSAQVREGYGLTETVTVCSVNPAHKNRIGSVGLPLANVLMKIVRPGTQEAADFDESGEICVSGPTAMIGYLNDEAATAATIQRHADGLDWIHSGDIGHCDEDGFFYFESRMKRMIKVSGVPVIPAQIETLVSRLEHVAEVAAYEMPDSYRMSAVKLSIVLDKNATARMNADSLRQFKERLNETIRDVIKRELLIYAVPEAIDYREQLPTTPVGKIDIKALEREAAQAATATEHD